MLSSDLETTWNGLVALCAEALRMDADEAARFASSKVARLVGLLPYLAGCEEPGRTALSHLATWVVANRGAARGVFDHKPADDVDILRRLAPIGDFRGGKPAVIEAGMRRLALCMVSGYERDRDKDARTRTYNPIVAGAWGPSRESKAPEATDPVVDSILDADTALRVWWDR